MRPDDAEAQKSEVHEATEDADTSRLAQGREDRVEKDVDLDPNPLPEHSFEEKEKTFPEDVRLRRDESDVGGPIVVEMDEPEDER